MKTNLAAALRYLFAALEHSIRACARTRELVRAAIARYISLAAAEAL